MYIYSHLLCICFRGTELECITRRGDRTHWLLTGGGDVDNILRMTLKSVVDDCTKRSQVRPVERT